MATTKEPVIIIGHGLSGLVAAYELSRAKVPVLILDQENEANLGGQAFWSLGGLFCVDSKEQRRNGIKDTYELALADWLNGARFDRTKDDYWPRQWAEAFVKFAHGGMEKYVKGLGLQFVRRVGWAERGDGRAEGHGNSVPRFHLTWGTGPEVVRIFKEPVLAAANKGLVEFKWRHRVDELVVENGRLVGVKGAVLQDSAAKQGEASSRVEVSKFSLRGAAVIVASGGIGGNIERVRKNWPVHRLGEPPKDFVIGVPAHVDGRMLDISQTAGANVINEDRMWHYTEGLKNWDPIWPLHGIRVIPGPSSLWLDATGKRMPPFLFPGFDTLATLKHITTQTGYHYTWFVLNRAIIAREFALSGSEQNPDITGKSVWGLLYRLLSSSGTVPVQNFQKYGEDFVVRDNLRDLVEGMNQLAAKSDGAQLDYDEINKLVTIRDMQLDNKFSKDAQVMAIRNARLFTGDKGGRVVTPERLLKPSNGPLIAVRLNLLTRKSLGGLETDLSANVMRPDGSRFPGLYAVGEAAGFGGGGVHGYSSLEGTFLGGCIFSGRTAGKALAEELGGAAGAKL